MKFFSVFSLLAASVSAGSSKDIACGSLIYVDNVDTNANLLITGYNHASRSGQPLVTAYEFKEGPAMWTVKGAHNESCPIGKRVSCGATIRLENQNGSNLHGHAVMSHISNRNLEVSGFGERGQGDKGDDFTVECIDGIKFWRVGERVSLRHNVTGAYLRTSRTERFTPQNCPGCPYHKQFEVSLARSKSGGRDQHWKAVDIIITANEDFDDEPVEEKDEL
eukprot:GDKJ01029171.1.p1 GENE.GDKJ01029171.1~~GDKJ01029171.1.p1  ORF type:complete len:221 (-),score=41.33 GDKJ01029171.1:217-879(-)